MCNLRILTMKKIILSKYQNTIRTCPCCLTSNEAKEPMVCRCCLDFCDKCGVCNFCECDCSKNGKNN